MIIDYKFQVVEANKYVKDSWFNIVKNAYSRNKLQNETKPKIKIMALMMFL